MLCLFLSPTTRHRFKCASGRTHLERSAPVVTVTRTRLELEIAVTKLTLSARCAVARGDGVRRRESGIYTQFPRRVPARARDGAAHLVPYRSVFF